MNNEYFNKWILFIIILHTILRFAAIGYIKEYKEPKVWEYGRIAENIVKGNGFSWTFNEWLPLQQTSIQPPLYPYIMSLFILFFPKPFLFIEIFQVVISIIAGLFLYLASKELFNNKVGYIAFIIYSIHPVFIYIPTQFLPLTFILMHIGIGLYLVIKINEKKKRKHFIFFGINGGLGLLIDPVIIFFLFSAGLYWIFYNYIKNTEFIKSFIITIIIVISIISPWMIRNYFVHKQFVFIKSPFGYNLWRGNNINATGTGRLHDGTNIDTTIPLSIKEKLKLPEYNKEIKADNLFREEAINFIKSHPYSFFKLSIRKIYYFWWFDPNHPKAENLLYRFSYILILFPGIAGFFILRNKWKLFSYLFYYFAFLTIIYAITIVQPRYHMQIDYILIIFASYFLHSFYVRTKHLCHE